MITTVNGSLDFVDNALVPAILNGADFDLKDKIQKITAPTLILWGKHDSVVKSNVSDYFHQKIANSSLIFIQDASHSPQLEVPNEVATAVLAFLEKK